MQELKPCPFCGKPMYERDISFVSFGIGVIGSEVACRCGCVMYLGDFKTGEEARAVAIKKWNTRAVDERFVDDGK